MQFQSGNRIQRPDFQSLFGCLEGVCKVSVKFLESASKLPRRYSEGIQEVVRKVSLRCLECVLKVSVKLLGNDCELSGSCLKEAKKVS